MKRPFDLLLFILAFTLFALPFLIISLAIKIDSKGPVFYWSDRIGVDGTVFKMPKFRTMREGTPALASHLLQDVNSYCTNLGLFLRKTSLDEIPQIYSVLTNKMSFVGPRPALFNQYDLINLRKKSGADAIKPGITGWAQINGRDEISIEDKAQFDQEYLEKRSFLFDLNILWITAIKVLKRDGISH